MAHARGNPRTPAVHTVIFDLGRVLIDFDWQRAVIAVARRTRFAPAEAEGRVLTGTRLHEFETGKITPAEFHADVERVLETAIPFAEFSAMWTSIFLEEITCVADVARALLRKGRLRVAVLSNTNALHVAFLRRTWPLLNELPNTFFSHEIGFRKPDPAAYRYVLGQLGVAGRGVVFVDDQPENVAAAEELGLRGIVAHSPEAVVAEFVRLGLTRNGN